MIKLKNTLLFLTSFILLSACQMQHDAGEREMLKKSGNTINVSDRTDMYNEKGLPNEKEGKMTNFGYVRHTKKEVTRDGRSAEVHAINREQVAHIISSMAVQLPNVNDAATLVTDEEVLIAYQTDTKNRSQTADQVKRTALSVVPSYFHIYVADNPVIIKQLEAYSRMDTNMKNMDSITEVTIREMLKYPQGKKIGCGQNPNNEGSGEMDHDVNRNKTENPKGMEMD